MNAVKLLFKNTIPWLGFGFFLVTFASGPFGSVFRPVGQAASWEYDLFMQVMFFIGTAMGCIVLKIFARHDFLRLWYSFGIVAYAVVELLCVAAQSPLSYLGSPMDLAVRGVLQLVVGILCATPLLFWISWLGRSRVFGHAAFITALIASYLLVLVMMLVLSSLLSGVVYAPPLAMGLCAIGSAVISLIVLRHTEIDATKDDKPRGTYHLTVYSFTTIGCLGFSWGIGMAEVLFTIGKGWLLESTFSLIIVIALATTLTAAMRVVARRGMRFGTFVRLSLVSYGVVLVTTPLLFNIAPGLIHPLCEVAIIFGEVSLIVFSIDVCRERGLSIADVFATNYALYVAATCIAVVLFWFAHTMLDGQVAWQLTTIVSICAVLVAIPFLPSRSSGAVAFTLDKLPEDEGYEASIAFLRERMAQKYNLTDSEAKVLYLLLQGMTREQIAVEVYLSPWTVKTRISSIYRKCGIHSYKELVKLVSDDKD